MCRAAYERGGPDLSAACKAMGRCQAPTEPIHWGITHGEGHKPTSPTVLAGSRTAGSNSLVPGCASEAAVARGGVLLGDAGGPGERQGTLWFCSGWAPGSGRVLPFVRGPSSAWRERRTALGRHHDIHRLWPLLCQRVPAVTAGGRQLEGGSQLACGQDTLQHLFVGVLGNKALLHADRWLCWLCTQS